MPLDPVEDTNGKVWLEIALLCSVYVILKSSSNICALAYTVHVNLSAF